MTLNPILIVFDCDGTLVDSQHLIAEAMRLAFIGADLVAPERSAILRTVGLSMPEALAYLAPEQHQETRDSLARDYRDLCATLRQRPNMQEPLFNGAASLLFDLAEREDVVLGIATGKSRRGVTRLIEHNNLEGVFSTIQTADDAPSKPHPGMLMRAIEETGATPETTVMIGDTSYDMVMASYANVASIGVTWGYHSAADLKKAGAHKIVGNFATLTHALEARFDNPTHYEAVA